MSYSGVLEMVKDHLIRIEEKLDKNIEQTTRVCTQVETHHKDNSIHFRLNDIPNGTGLSNGKLLTIVVTLTGIVSALVSFIF